MMNEKVDSEVLVMTQNDMIVMHAHFLFDVGVHQLFKDLQGIVTSDSEQLEIKKLSTDFGIKL